jgi:hypothetical protein
VEDGTVDTSIPEAWVAGEKTANTGTKARGESSQNGADILSSLTRLSGGLDLTAIVQDTFFD